MITPPTDSLYKFVAISGLIVLAWGVIFPWTSSIEYKLKVIDVTIEINKEETEVEKLSEKVKKLKQEESRIRAETPLQKSRLSQIATEKNNLHIKMQEAQRPVDKQKKVIRVLSDSLDTYNTIGIASTVLGFLLTLTGFLLWYQRVQKYVDKKVKQDST